ncbi:MAG TPA: ISAzo13 family transposase, partial [Thioploca sp.]|nr:ISAzo13 family transposase [Thioploca sp.]
LISLYNKEGNPVNRCDTNRCEKIGNIFREGKIYTTETIEVFDHDFPSLAEGVAVPHVIYEIERNEAYASIGTSRDTSEFACDSYQNGWYNYGKWHYSDDGWWW